MPSSKSQITGTIHGATLKVRLSAVSTIKLRVMYYHSELEDICLLTNFIREFQNLNSVIFVIHMAIWCFLSFCKSARSRFARTRLFDARPSIFSKMSARTRACSIGTPSERMQALKPAMISTRATYCLCATNWAV